MPASQFTIYTSADPYGPGLMTGQTGSLANILDACLVNGYTGKPAAGWTKPIPNVSASVGSLPQLACYKQASGSQFTLFVNDAAPHATATGKEAWVCGYELITGLTSSLYPTSTVYTASAGNGGGYGQFPLSSQQLTYGHVVWRKSTSADGIGRPWIIAADDSTVYIWVQTGDAAGYYYHGAFGQIYSFGGSNDRYACFVYGRAVENSTGGPSNSWVAVIATACGYQGSGQVCPSTLGTAQPGHWLARPFSGFGFSTGFTKKGDSNAINAGATSNPGAGYMSGPFATPNMGDNSLYIQPLQVVEPSSIMIRGRLRGLYQVCHPVASFNDGQKIIGSGDYYGKTFTVIKLDENGVGLWLLETSNTVETN